MPELSPESVRLPFEMDDRIDAGLLTAHTGVPLVLERFRRLWAAQVINAQVCVKQRQQGDLFGLAVWMLDNGDIFAIDCLAFGLDQARPSDLLEIE
ncbi:MAG: hypothetical protein CV088_11585 [Nitrospira sp. LK70]|nr:hypothetical protein [Nitrospira sp. LK70]